MTSNQPRHPGEMLYETYIAPSGFSIRAMADHLGVTRKTLSFICNGHSRISPEMAIRLSQAFNTTAEYWLQRQLDYDIWLARQQLDAIDVEPVRPTKE
ncbi:MAG: HigA family addiction module antitoxin [Thiohalorhabdaceae bacterium]